MKGNYAVFLRKSREDADAERHGHYETLAKHEEELSQLADSRGLKVVETYRELVSGDSLAQRPECQRLLRDVAKGSYDGVLVVDIQRLTRGDMIDQGTIMSAFRYSHTLIITPTKTYDPADEHDNDFVELSMFFGRMELSAIKKRLLAGKERSVREGQYIGTVAPFGWDKITVDGKHTLAPNAQNGLVIEWAERIADRQATCQGMAMQLNRSGIRTVRGGNWDMKTIKTLLTNPIWIGYVRWNQHKTVTVMDEGMRKEKKRVPAEPILVKGLHDGTMPLDLWERLQRTLRGKSMRGRYRRELRNPLAGLLVCKRCGRAMACKHSTKQPQLRVSHPDSNKHECMQMSAYLSTVLAMLCDSLGDIARDMELTIADDGKARGYLLQDEASARAAFDDAKKAAANLLRLAEKGLITDEEFAERKAAADAAARESAAEIDEAERRLANLPDVQALATTVNEAIDMLGGYEADPKAVNDFLHGFIDKIEYERDPQTGKIRLRVCLK